MPFSHPQRGYRIQEGGQGRENPFHIGQGEDGENNSDYGKNHEKSLGVHFSESEIRKSLLPGQLIHKF
ncbi:hypothetical protein D3C75_1268550 [compost metagenome]